MLNERMDEFTSRIEEVNSKFIVKKHSLSQQNLAPQSDGCNGSAPTNLFVSQLGNGTLIPHSSSSNQLSKESPMMEEVSLSPFPLTFLCFLKLGNDFADTV
jgi:uridine kinase